MLESVTNIDLPPADVAVMLRAHAELHCLTHEVIPVLRQLQAPGALPDEQRGAAIAYLEMAWLAAGRHAAETDTARRQLAGLAAAENGHIAEDDELWGHACRYYEAVSELRDVVARRVTLVLRATRNGVDPRPVARADVA